MQTPGQLAKSFSLRNVGSMLPVKKRVFSFSEGTVHDHTLLGRKGSRICELQKLDLPVPPGFIISTDAAKEFMQVQDRDRDRDRTDIDRLFEDYRKGILELERVTGRKFGEWTTPEMSTKSVASTIKSTANVMKSATNTVVTETKGLVMGGVDTKKLPLILSVRSSAVAEMPGAMETILNIGLNDDVVNRIARDFDNPRWIYDCYRKLLQMFGNVVYGVDKQKYRAILAAAREDAGVDRDSDLSAGNLQSIIQEFQRLANVPEDPWEQLKLAITSIYRSWYTSKAEKFRESYGVSNDVGVAIIVQTMVFGNICDRCGVGCAFNRNPNTGDKEFFGEFVPQASGDDIIGRSDNIRSLTEMQKEHPGLFYNIQHVLKLLERNNHELQEIEFTVEQGNLFILQLNKGKHSAFASVKIVVAMVKEKLITEREAIMRLDAKQLDYYLKPTLALENMDPQNVNFEKQVFGNGIAASMGNATGKLVFSCKSAIKCKEQKIDCILVLPDCLTDDVEGMEAANGVVTLRGGLASHAAAWMRSVGKPAVTMLQNCQFDFKDGVTLRSAKDEVLKEGDVVTIDGSTGTIYRGDIPCINASFNEDFFALLNWARKYKKMDVLACASTEQEIHHAFENGADGIGLLKTEQLFFDKHRIDLVRQIVLTDSDSERAWALARLEEMQKENLYNIFKTVGDRELIVRLLDLSLNQIIPDPSDVTALEDIFALSQRMKISIEQLKNKLDCFAEKNPLLGIRGCRLGILFPYFVTMQIRAIVGAAIMVQKERISVKPKILMPTSFSENELKRLVPLVTESIAQSCVQSALVVDPKETDIRYDVGIDIACPRACLKMNKFLEGENLVTFANIDTDELTQLVFGVSQAESPRYMHMYIERHILSRDPFETIDSTGVGTLIGTARDKARNFNSNFRVNVCGGHCADPNSIQYFNSIGMSALTVTDNKWIPTAMVAAAQAEIKSTAPVSTILDSLAHMLAI